jgi:hypothetical protein
MYIEHPILQTYLPFLFVQLCVCVCVCVCVNDFPLEICLLNRDQLQCHLLKAFKNKNNLLYFSVYELPVMTLFCPAVIVCQHHYFAAGMGGRLDGLR